MLTTVRRRLHSVVPTVRRHLYIRVQNELYFCVARLIQNVRQLDLRCDRHWRGGGGGGRRGRGTGRWREGEGWVTPEASPAPRGSSRFFKSALPIEHSQPFQYKSLYFQCFLLHSLCSQCLFNGTSYICIGLPTEFLAFSMYFQHKLLVLICFYPLLFLFFRLTGMVDIIEENNIFTSNAAPH